MTEIIISLEALSDISGKDIKLSKYDEVVTRCKDCQYWRANTQFCAMFSGVCTAHRMPPDGYCSEAKRKEECGHQ